MKRFLLCFSLLVVLLRRSESADEYGVALQESATTVVEKEIQSFGDLGSPKRIENARRLINSFLNEGVETLDTESRHELTPRLYAAFLVIAERGTKLDYTSLVKLAEVRVFLSPTGGIPLLPNVSTFRVVSRSGESAKQQFIACYSLDKILRREVSEGASDLILASKDTNISLEGSCRILGVLCEQERNHSAEYAFWMRAKFGAEIDSAVDSILSGRKRYWDNLRLAGKSNHG